MTRRLSRKKRNVARRHRYFSRVTVPKIEKAVYEQLQPGMAKVYANSFFLELFR